MDGVCVEAPLQPTLAVGALEERVRREGAGDVPRDDAVDLLHELPGLGGVLVARRGPREQIPVVLAFADDRKEVSLRERAGDAEALRAPWRPVPKQKSTKSREKQG